MIRSNAIIKEIKEIWSVKINKINKVQGVNYAKGMQCNWRTWKTKNFIKCKGTKN